MSDMRLEIVLGEDDARTLGYSCSIIEDDLGYVLTGFYGMTYEVMMSAYEDEVIFDRIAKHIRPFEGIVTALRYRLVRHQGGIKVVRCHEHRSYR